MFDILLILSKYFQVFYDRTFAFYFSNTNGKSRSDHYFRISIFLPQDLQTSGYLSIDCRWKWAQVLASGSSVLKNALIALFN